MLLNKIKKQIHIKKHARESVCQLFRHLTGLVAARSMEHAALRIVLIHSSTRTLFCSYFIRLGWPKSVRWLFHWAEKRPRSFVMLLCMVEMRRLIYERKLLLLNWTLARDVAQVQLERFLIKATRRKATVRQREQPEQVWGNEIGIARAHEMVFGQAFLTHVIVELQRVARTDSATGQRQ
jgi:hypothetical protein